MKSLSPLLCGLVLLSTVTNGFAAIHGPNTSPVTPAPAAPTDGILPQGAPTSAPATLKLNDYIVAVTTVVSLSDAEKKELHDLYTADGVALQSVLNDDKLSPLQKAQQVSDLRDVRNEKIASLLHDIDKQHAFFQVEAVYRVSLTELAADGGLLPPPSPDAAPPAPATAPTPTVPPAKSGTGGAMTTGASPSQPASTTPPPATNIPVTEPPPAPAK
jgi:hypothetical protein